jgi:flagellar export protein FliJ
MATFKFRAAAALDWRRRQEDAAAVHLAAAEAALRAATADREAAEQVRAGARRQADAGHRQGTDGATLAWHRNWIVYCGTVVAARMSTVECRIAELTDAKRRWYEARQRRLALERLRDRALQRFRQEQDRLEMKMLDEVARLRYLANIGTREGDSL